MKFDSHDIFRYQDLERNLYTLNQQPDRQAKAFIIQGEALASSDIILKVKDKNPLHVYYEINNRGTKLTHRIRHVVHLDHNNLLGFDDVFNSSFTTTEEGALNGGSFSYNFPLQTIPVDLSLSGGYAQSSLIGSLKSAKITGESLNFSPAITYTLIQDPAKTINLYLALKYINSLSSIDHVRVSADRMRSLNLGSRLTFQDAGGRTILNPEIHFGLPDFLGGLDSTDTHATVANSGGEFTYYTMNAARVQRLPQSLVMILRGGGQWTRDTLTSIEQIRAGGATSVRGYSESESAGDYGWNGGAEINTPVPFLCSSLRLAGFLDSAKVYTRERSLPTSVKSKFLMGTGFGLRLDIDRTLSGQIDLGFPVGDDSADKNKPQVHVSMKAGF
jgi:hemolysin activation/secretion protein